MTAPPSKQPTVTDNGVDPAASTAARGLCSLDDVLTTSELARRPPRPPNHAGEARALVELVRVMTETPGEVLQQLVDEALALCRAGSAGISIAETEDGADIFRWHATAGAFARYRWGTMPRDFSPCGAVLERDATQLMAEPVRYYPYIESLCSYIHEVLLVPFYQGDTAVGTVWIVSHTPDRKFDAEDARLVTSLARFAGAAVTTLSRLGEAEAARRARERAEALVSAQKQVLEDLVRGAPLADVLAAVCEGLERQMADGAIACVMLADEDGRSLRHGAGRRCPAGYVEDFGRVPIGPAVGSCGTAAHRREPVIVADIAADPLWADFRDLAARHGLAACWSTPMLSSQGSVLGTLAVYHPTPRHPGEADLRALDVLARTAGIAVERKRSEQSLRESEVRYRLVADAANDAIWDWNLVTDQVVWNEGVRTCFGYTEGEVLPGTSWWLERIHPEDAQRVAADIRAHIDRGPDEWQTEYRFRRADGSSAVVLARGRVLRDATGRPIRMVGSMLDLTERKQAEAALRAAEERFAFVRRSSGVGFWYCDLPFDVLEWDERVKEHFHLPPDARVTIDTFYARIHPDDREPTRAAIERSIREHAPYDIHYRTVDPATGAEKWIRAIGRTSYAGDGTPIQFDGVTLDVTEQKTAADRLRESEARFRTFADAAPAMLWVTEPDGACSFLSQGWYEFTGQSEAEGLGFGWLDAVHPDDRAEAGARFRAANERKQPFSLEHRLRHRDGAYRWVIDAGRPRFSPAGEFLGYVGNVFDITDRKAAEAQLRQKDERLNLFLENVKDYAVIVADTEGTVVEWQGGAEHITGFSAAEALGRPIEFIFAADDRAAAAVEIARAAREGKAEDKRWHVRKDGARFFANGVMTALRDEAGNARGFAKVFRDETAKYEGERAVQESREQLKAVFDSAGEGLYVLDLDGRCTYMNAAGAEVLGYRPEELIGRSLHDVVHHTRADGHPYSITECVARTALQGRSIRVDDEVLWRKDGRPVPVRYSANPMVVGGVTTGAVITFTDMTERKRAEQERERLLAQEKLRADLLARVANASRQVNAVLSVDSIARILAEEARVILGAHVAVTSFTGDRPRDQAVRALALSDKYGEYRGRAVRPDGLSAHVCRTNRPLRLTEAEVERHPEWDGRTGGEAAPLPTRGWLGVPLVGHGGRNIGLIQVSDKQDGDFTAEDEAVLLQLAAIAAVGIENARLYDSLREQDRRKDEFLATLAHELRNPLAPLRNGLTVLRTGKAAAGGDGLVDMMERQFGQLVHLVDDLLDVSRVTSGKITLRKERVELRAVIDAAVETSRPLIEQGRHRLSVSLPREPLRLDADPTRLAQAVANLLNNAAKYTPEGGRIDLSAERLGGEVIVRVRDDGVGIATDMLPRVFELFTQVGKTLDRSQGGLGIGLALVKKLVELHGGAIAAESAGLGTGSTFVVRLPLAEGLDAEAPAAAGSSARTAPAAARRVLVVDDNVDGADSLAMLLQLSGHVTSTAYTGPDALTAAAAFDPEIVLLDIGLPGMNGYEVAQRLRADPRHAGAVLVALTGWGTADDRRRAREVGFDHHLTKPAEAEKVQALLASIPAKREAP